MPRRRQEAAGNVDGEAGDWRVGICLARYVVKSM